MSEERVTKILDAAYLCFTRHGIRRTTMDDIAAAAGMSRPSVYQYVRNKDDAFRRLAERMFTGALAQARAVARVDGPPAERLAGVCAVKLALTQRIWQDSSHAAELIGANATLGADLNKAFTADLAEVLIDTLRDAASTGEIVITGGRTAEVAEILLALTRGLEADLTDPDLPGRRLRSGVDLIVAGLTHG